MTTLFRDRFFKRAAIALFMLLGISQMAQAQPIVGTKTMCEIDSVTGACGPDVLQTSVGTPIAYQFVIDNSFGNTAIPNYQVTEDHSPDFVPTGAQPVTCVDQNGTAVNPVFTAGPPALIEFPSLPALSTLTCTFEGSFNQPGATVPNRVYGPLGLTPNNGDESTVVVTDALQFSGDLALTKEIVNYADLDLTAGQTQPQIATYRITLTATQATQVTEHFRIFDQMGLGLGSIGLVATYDPASLICNWNGSGGTQSSVCGVDANLGNPLGNFNNFNNFISFQFSAPGFLLEANDTVVLEFDVEFTLPPAATCQRQDVQLAKNAAFLTFADGVTALNDLDNANNSTGYSASDAVVQQILTDLPATSDCAVSTGGGGTPPPPSPLEVTKTAIDGPGVYPWGDDIRYEINITNNGPFKVTDLNLFDYVQNLAFTPNFDVQLISASLICAPSSTCGNLNPNGGPGPLGQILGYSDTEGMVDGYIDFLAPGETLTLEVVLNYSKPHCDTAPFYEDKFIRNVAAVNHFYSDPDDEDAIYFGTSAGSVDVQMDFVDKCDIGVKKTQITPGPIIFDQPMVYELTFYNGEETEAYGTLIDALRIVDNNYAQGMSVDHQFSCSDNGLVSGYAPSGAQTGTVIHVGQQNQGLRLMDHPGFVTFQNGGELVCRVEIVVTEPSSSDPYCFSNINETPHLENVAFFDQGLFYNSNLAFPTGPQGYNWDAVQTELPRCIHALLDKKVEPLTTGPQGPDPLYTVKLLNRTSSGSDGDFAFASGSGDGIHLVDAFDLTGNPNVPTLSLAADPCAGSGAPCTWGNVPQDVMVHGVRADLSFDYSYTATPNPEFSPHELCNDIAGEFLINGAPYDPDRWFVRGNLQDRACVQIRNTLRITKVFESPADEALLNDQGDITVDVNCTHLDTSITPTVLSTTLNAASGWQADVWVHVGSSCTVTEQTPPASMLFPHCTWGSPIYSPAQSISTNASQNVWPVEITNSFSCEYADLGVQKQVNPPANPAFPAHLVPTPPPAGTSFEIDVLCTDGVNPDVTTTLTFGAAGGTQTLAQIPVGMSCTATEPNLPSAEDGCSWQVVYAPAPSVTIGTGQAKSLITAPNIITVENHYLCDDGSADPLYDVVVEKIVNAGPAAAGYTLEPVPATANFAITPDCGAGALGTLNFSGAGTQMVPGQPLGTVCTATESISSSNPNDECRWRSDVTGTTVSATGLNTIIVENNFECPEQPRVTKSCDPIPVGSTAPYTLNCEIEITGGANLPVPSFIPMADFFGGPLVGGALAPAVGTVTLSSTDVTLPPAPLCQYDTNPSAQALCLLDSAEIVAAGGTVTIDASVTFMNAEGHDMVTNCAFIGELSNQPLPDVGEPSSNKMAKSSTLTDSAINTDDPNWHCVDVPLPPSGEYELTVEKLVNAGPATAGYELMPPPLGSSFAITPECDGTALAPLSFTASGVQIVVGQTLGAQCTATENISSSVPNDTCRWRTDITGTTLSANGTNRVIVENNYECPEEFRITKTCDPIPAGASNPYTLSCQLTITGGANLPVPGYFFFGDWLTGLGTNGQFIDLPGNMTLSSNDLPMPIQPCNYLSTPTSGAMCGIENADIVAAGGSVTIDADVTFTSPDGVEQVRNCAMLSDVFDGQMPNVFNQKSSNKFAKNDPVPPVDNPQLSCVDVDLPDEIKEPEGDLSITKTLVKEEGPNKTYELVPALTGDPITQPDLYVLDYVPAGMTVTNAGGTDWQCNPLPLSGPDTLECRYTGSYPITAGAMSSIYVEVIDKGAEKPNCAEIVTDRLQLGYLDTNLSNNSDCEKEPGKPDVSIDKTLELIEPNYGIFTLQVGLTGGPISSPMLTVNDTVPAGMVLDFIGNAPWVCQPSSVSGPDTVTCEYQGPYPIQPSTVIPPIRFKAEFEEGLENCAEVITETIEEGFDDSNPDNNSDCVTTTGTPVEYKPASFEIAKGIDPNGAAAPAGTTFHFTVTNCTDGGTPSVSSFTFTAPNDFGSPLGARQLVTISGATSPTPSCLVTELTPTGPLPAGCAWRTGRLSIDNGANWSNGAITVPAAASGNGPTIVPVSNRLDCKKPKDGAIKLFKTVTQPNANGPALPNGPIVTVPPTTVNYPIMLTCRNASGQVISTHTHNFPSTGGGTSFANLPAGLLCTASEGALPVTDTCSWQTSITPAGGVTVPAGGTAQIEVKNTYTCDNTIYLEVPRRFDVIKEIHPDSAPIPLGTDFPFSVTGCDTQNDTFSFEYSSSFSGGTASQTVAHTGGACTVTEQTPVSTLADGCNWAPAEYSTDNGASWSTTPASINGVTLQIVGAALPSVRVRNRVVCEATPPTVQVTKTCTPNPLILTAPGPQTLTCTLTITGGNMIAGQLIQMTDVITGASGITPVITSAPVSYTGTQILGCQQYGAPNEVLCLANSADLLAQGSLSTDLTVTIDNAWETGDLRNCVRAFHQAFGNGSYGSATVCDDITVIKDEKITPKTPDLTIQKASLGACSINRAAQTYTCGFGFEISNNGDGDYQGPLVVTDEFLIGPNAQSVEQIGGDGWSCPGNNAQGASCLKGVSDLAAGASDGFQMELTLAGLRKGGEFCNAATLGLGESDFMRTIVVQEAMRLLGIDGGPADGKSGAQTKRGVRALQSNLGLEQTGEIDAALLTALGVPMDMEARSDEVCVELPPMPLPPLQCERSTARNISDTECACRFDRMFKTSKTSCSCEKGLDFVAGKGCVKQPDRPKGCPDGQTLIDGACAIVEDGPLVCDPETTVARGKTCACKLEGMTRISPTQCR